jgi:hypothetical protein
MIKLSPELNEVLNSFVAAVHDGDPEYGDPQVHHDTLRDALAATGQVLPTDDLELDQAEDEDGDPCHGLYNCRTGDLIAVCE